MTVNGEKFFYMHNHQEAKFELGEVQVLLVQPVQVELVDAEEMSVVSEETVYLVIVVLDDGSMASTEPLKNETKAHLIASVLQKKLHRHYGSE